MPVPYRSTVVGSDVDTVWATVRRFDGLPDWHPAIGSSELQEGTEHQVGAVRRLTLKAGEQLMGVFGDGVLAGGLGGLCSHLER